MAKKYAFGVLWTEYTPAVEGQLIRDIMAVKSSLHIDQLTVVVPSMLASTTLRNLGVLPVLAPATIAKMWVLYQTVKEPLEAPEHAEETIVRKLYCEKADGTLNTEEHNGYFLPRLDRVAPQSRVLVQVAPTSVGQTDPYVIQRWC